MNINKYKKVLRRRLIFTIAGFVCLWIGCAVFFLNKSLYETSEFARGFMPGVAAGLSFALIRSLINITLALKNGERLKKIFIKENDERTKHIAYKTARFTIVGMIILLYIGMIAAGLFNMMIVFWTLYIAVFTLIALMLAGKIYFNITG